MKRVLFDEDVPQQLRRELSEFEIRTVQEEGWASAKNGVLLARSSGVFDVLVTADKRLQYQQNIATYQIGVVVLGTRDTRLPRLLAVIGELRTAIDDVQPGTVMVVRSNEQAASQS